MDKNAKVDHPAHYNQGPLDADGTAKYETIKVIEDWSLGFCLGNALKYILRAPHKGTENQDLAKSRWYLNRYIISDDHARSAKFYMSADSVAEAWSLTNHLASAVRHIRNGDARRALVHLDAHVIDKTMENV